MTKECAVLTGGGFGGGKMCPHGALVPVDRAA